MDSLTFFDNHQKKWNGKQGIYVIENELFSKELKKPIYKVGYARYDLGQRIADYRTAYSPFIHFKIHLLYEVPEKVRGQRANFALLTEKRVQNTLTKMGKRGDGEWYYNLDAIFDVISSIRLEHLQLIEVSKKWTYYPTRISSKRVEVDSEKNVCSKLSELIVMTEEEKDRRFRRSTKNLDLRNRTKVIHSTKKY